jgi:ribosomal protein RSM22 (predicted rRNA methylase)
MIPEALSVAIEAMLSKTNLGKLSTSSQDLSERYREKEGQSRRFLLNDGDYLAYLATRMPATFAAISRVFEEMVRRMPSLCVESLLDVGAGPGTGLWAAAYTFPHLKEAIMIERERGLIEIGKTLTAGADLPRSKWIELDCKQFQTQPVHDLVLMSYAINELEPSSWAGLVSKLWESTGKFLVIIEPGTPAGFERIRLLREMLIEWGACIVAPCPHQQRCPGEWCHFSERLERSFVHRYAKGATMGYEDEKFSYIVASKTTVEASEPRVIRHPQHRPGNIGLTLCTNNVIKNINVSKKQKDKYKIARKIKWGDLYTE